MTEGTDFSQWRLCVCVRGGKEVDRLQKSILVFCFTPRKTSNLIVIITTENGTDTHHLPYVTPMAMALIRESMASQII